MLWAREVVVCGCHMVVIGIRGRRKHGDENVECGVVERRGRRLGLVIE